MRYAQAKQLLKKHTTVVELSDGHGGQVIVCPEYQGRVMTSTCNNDEGASLGWVNRSFIEKGEKNGQFNNYGGEDRLWLSPEGGPYSLWFAPGDKQELSNWHTPAALNDGSFREVKPTESKSDQGDGKVVHLTRDLEFVNTAKTKFELTAHREIRLLGSADFGKMFGAGAMKSLDDGKLKWVGYQTANTIVNRGPAMKKDSGLVSIWILSMMVSGPETMIVVPYRAGDESELGPVVKSDYFDQIPADRLHITPSAILFKGDSHYRSKIGVSQRRGKPVAGSIDFASGVLTLISFDLPENPAGKSYMNNSWGVPQELPYTGDVFNSYNDGPPGGDKPQLGAFYEIESLSPAAELATGEKLSHHQRTFHIQGDLAALALVAKAALGVDLDEVKKVSK